MHEKISSHRHFVARMIYTQYPHPHSCLDYSFQFSSSFVSIHFPKVIFHHWNGGNGKLTILLRSYSTASSCSHQLDWMSTSYSVLFASMDCPMPEHSTSNAICFQILFILNEKIKQYNKNHTHGMRYSEYFDCIQYFLSIYWLMIGIRRLSFHILIYSGTVSMCLLRKSSQHRAHTHKSILPPYWRVQLGHVYSVTMVCAIQWWEWWLRYAPCLHIRPGQQPPTTSLCHEKRWDAPLDFACCWLPSSESYYSCLPRACQRNQSQHLSGILHLSTALFNYTYICVLPRSEMAGRKNFSNSTDSTQQSATIVM